MVENEKNVPIEPKKIKFGEIIGKFIMFFYALWFLSLLFSVLLIDPSTGTYSTSIPEYIITIWIYIPAVFLLFCLIIFLLGLLVSIIFYQ